MNESMDRSLMDWIVDAPDRGPESGLERALAATRRTSQRPGWTFPSQWLPANLAPSFPDATPRRSTWALALAVVALIGLLLASLVMGVGRRPTPPPFGPAGNGLIAFRSDGRIQLAGPDGTHLRTLSSGDAQEFGPAFSADGTRVAFWSGESATGPMTLLSAALDGSPPIDLSVGERFAIPDPRVPPSWSPDGSQVAFSARSGTALRLFLAAADGSGVRDISPPASTVDRSEPRFSPDGRWLAYRRVAATTVALAVSRPDGSDERILVSQPVTADVDRVFQGYVWSPDSTQIAYQFLGPGGGDVAVVDLDGTVTSIAADPASEYNPAWSPDGELIAFMSDDGVATDVAGPDGTARRTLGRHLFEGAGCRLFWSPDGTTLLGAPVGSACDAASMDALVGVRLDDPSRTFRVALPVDGLPSWQRSPP